MSKTVELPDAVYDAIAATASAHGSTPAEWIAQTTPVDVEPAGDLPQARSLFDDLKAKGLIGGLREQQDDAYNAAQRQSFGDYLDQKRREGRL